jgi:hypothetical protein
MESAPHDAPTFIVNQGELQDRGLLPVVPDDPIEISVVISLHSDFHYYRDAQKHRFPYGGLLQLAPHWDLQFRKLRVCGSNA